MKRIVTALILIPTIAWVVLKAPHSVFMAVLTLTGLLAYHEFDQIAGANGIQKAGWIGMAAGLAILFVPDPGVLFMLIAMLGLSLAMRASNFRASLPAAGAFVLGIVYIFGSWHTVDLLRQINPHWAMFAMILSWAGDTAAMYIGKAFGKHKMAPRVSPAKTWEGAAGSVVGSMLVGLVYAYYLMPSESFAFVAAAGIAGNVAGQLGDLCESALKRGAGMKDSGTLLPGHGGWLDRIDASLFSVPMVYALVVLARQLAR